MEGVTHMVALLAPAPEAASRFAVTPASLDAMWRKIWTQGIGPVQDFGFVGADAPGAELADLAALLGVDALLLVQPSVYAEVGRVTEYDSGSPYEKDIPSGSVVLRTIVTCRFQLFTAETGKVTGADGLATALGLLPGGEEEDRIFELGPMTPLQATSFMRTEAYAALFEVALTEAQGPLRHLLRNGAQGGVARPPPRSLPHQHVVGKHAQSE
jgi:hypothetical protein